MANRIGDALRQIETTTQTAMKKDTLASLRDEGATPDAHLKRQAMGREVVVAITKGKLDFGPWEQIFYGEFYGRRKKRALVKVIGE